jgi:hypothetical protein
MIFNIEECCPEVPTFAYLNQFFKKKYFLFAKIKKKKNQPIKTTLANGIFSRLKENNFSRDFYLHRQSFRFCAKSAPNFNFSIKFQIRPDFFKRHQTSKFGNIWIFRT